MSLLFNPSINLLNCCLIAVKKLKENLLFLNSFLFTVHVFIYLSVITINEETSITINEETSPWH